MPLYVRDEAVNDLADQLAARTGRSKTAAVRWALEEALAAQAAKKTLAQRVTPLQTAARGYGLRADGYDDKALMDDLSGSL